MVVSVPAPGSNPEGMNDVQVPSSGGIRVVRLFSRLNIGGPSVHVILLTAGLAARGYRTRLVVGQESAQEGNLLDLAAEKGVPCERLDALGREIRVISDVRALWGLYRVIRDFRPFVVHTHAAKAGLLGRVAARLAGVPVVVHTYHGHVLRGYFGPVKNAVFRTLEALLSPLSDALIAVSEAVKEDLVALAVARAEHIRVVPLGLDLERYTKELPRGALRAATGVPAEAPLVGMVGRLVPIKDVPTFLRAAVLVRAARPDARFALVGDGEERSALERESQRLGLDGVLSFHGWRRDLEAVYADLDVVVNSSRNEGTPVALIEALASARPVVATRVGGTADLLAAGAFGSLVPPEDPQALAAAILDVLAEPGAARRRALLGRSQVLARHGAGRLVADIDRLYRELLSAKGVAA
jgi:glycosyltransferase involved in cell wall biosynthesis